MIVKIQRALNQPNQMLIYNEDRSMMYEGSIPRRFRRLLGDKLKIYAAAYVNKRDVSR